MTVHFLNCFTCNARIPASMRTGMLTLLVETRQGLVLVDTGLGTDDYIHKSGILRLFQVLTKVPLDPREAAIRQVERLGYRAEDVRHIVLTHMHFDHCGGLADFPDATVHVHRCEYEAFVGPMLRWTDLAYVRSHIAHQPAFRFYDAGGEKWFDFEAVRLPFDPEMWLVPLFGHTRGQCGVAIHAESGWLFHIADAGVIRPQPHTPDWLVKAVLGPHSPRLKRFAAAHPEVMVTTGHMPLEFFEGSPCMA